MNRLKKHELEALRKAAGYGYAQGVEKILRVEKSITVEKIHQIYDVAHGKNKDEQIMEAFLTYVIRKTKASSTVQNLASEALKLIAPLQASA